MSMSQYLNKDHMRIDNLRRALVEIIHRSYNGELGTSKVIDMRKIAEDALLGDNQ